MEKLEKSFYYVANWDDAAAYRKALGAMGIPYMIESPGSGLPIQQGQLAIVFPDVPVRMYSSIRELFGTNGERYPSPIFRR